MTNVIAVGLMSAGIALSAFTQQPPDVKGTWSVQTEFAWLPQLECRLEQKDTTLKGSCGLGTRSEPVEGTVGSEDVSWIFDVPGSGPNGATIRYAFSGKVGQGERRITGSVTGTDLSKNWPEQLAKFTGEKR